MVGFTGFLRFLFCVCDFCVVFFYDLLSSHRTCGTLIRLLALARCSC